MTPDDLDTRIAALERRVPVDAAPPDIAPARRRTRRRALALTAAPVLVPAIAATAVAGVNLVGTYVIGPTGPVDPALAGAGLECMTPPEAAAWLASHGYDAVVWDTVDVTAGGETIPLDAQVAPPLPSGAPEQVTVVAIGDGGIIGTVPDGAGTITVTGDAVGQAPEESPGIAITLPATGAAHGMLGATTPPAEGVVIVGNVIDGTLHMLVDETDGATRPATCPAK
jgi:hypothetical protein